MWTAIIAALLLQQAPKEPSKTATPVVASKPKIEITAQINPAKIQLGDQTMLEVTATHNKDVRLFFPAAPDLKPFRVVGKPTGPVQVIQGDQLSETWRVPIAAMRLGRRKIPPFPIDYEDPNADTGRVNTPPVPVNVLPRLDPNNGRAEGAINDPALALLDTNWVLVLFLMGLGVIALTALLTLVAVRYVTSLPRRGPPAPPPRPAHEVALEKLTLLRDDKLMEISQFKIFTFRLSEILREYLGLRYMQETLELTTSELLNRMKVLGPQGLSVYELEAFLQATDLVKFANLTPSYSDTESTLKTCEQIISNTRRSNEESAILMESEKRKRLLEKPAHPFKRLFALLVDLLFCASLSTALVFTGRWLAVGWMIWVDVAFIIAFLLLRDGYGSGSPGKVLTGLALTPQDSPISANLSLSARIIRNLPLLLPVAGQTMEFVVMTYAADGRRVGDRWAKARVLDRRPESSERAFLFYSVAAAAALLVVAWFVPFVWWGASP